METPWGASAVGKGNKC